MAIIEDLFLKLKTSQLKNQRKLISIFNSLMTIHVKNVN
jgi:hypothetical protein